MAVRGIRGATTVDSDEPEQIVMATSELLVELIERNTLDPDEVAGAWFTTTPDLCSEFPAVAARRLGWVDVPLLCGHEMDTVASNPRSIPRCIRVLILLNSELRQADMQFVYLRGALVIKTELERARAQHASRPEPGDHA